MSVGAHAPRESGPSVMEILDNEMYVADRHLGNAVDKLRAKITPKEDEDASPTKPSGTPGRSYLCVFVSQSLNCNVSFQEK